MVSISSKHLREVSDPVGELLTQLHKIVYLAKVRIDDDNRTICYPLLSIMVVKFITNKSVCACSSGPGDQARTANFNRSFQSKKN